MNDAGKIPGEDAWLYELDKCVTIDHKRTLLRAFYANVKPKQAAGDREGLAEALRQIAEVLPTDLQNPASTELWAAKAKDCVRIARAALKASQGGG